MKKVLVSIILAFVMVFTASGCAISNPLSFSNAWNEGTNPGIGFTETLNYSVELKKDTVSGPNFSYTSAVTDYDYNLSGEYQVSITATTISNADFNSDIFAENLNVYKITSNLVLTGNYGETDIEDYINTECYFARESYSLFPVYSKTENKSTLLHTYNNKYEIQELKTETETLYNKNSYTINKKVEEKVNGTWEFSSNATNSYEATYENYVDNNQLLFAIRNLGIEAETSKYLSTVSYGYGTTKSLRIQHLGKNSETAFGLTYNDTTYNQATFPVDILSFSVATEGSSGMSQIVYLQNGKEETTNLNRALIVKYIEPLTTYSQFKCMGSLVYTLKSVNII